VVVVGIVVAVGTPVAPIGGVPDAEVPGFALADDAALPLVAGLGFAVVLGVTGTTCGAGTAAPGSAAVGAPVPGSVGTLVAGGGSLTLEVSSFEWPLPRIANTMPVRAAMPTNAMPPIITIEGPLPRLGADRAIGGAGGIGIAA
jgi:hypothetical protein